MKKVKIFGLILALVLIVSSVALVASADDATPASKPEIVSANINYQGNYALVLAIDASTVQGETVYVQVWDETGKDLGTFPAEAVKEKVNNTECYIVKTPGISQKDMAKTYTYQAIDGEGNEGDEETISVAQYFYQRLFIDGIINATEEKDVLRKEYYISTLEGGALLEQIVDNKTAGSLVTDYIFGYVKDVEVSLSLETKTVTLPEYSGTPPTGQEFAGYTVTKYTKTDGVFKGETSAAAVGETVTYDAHTVVTPAFEDIKSRGQGKYFNDEAASGLEWTITNSTGNNIANRSEWWLNTTVEAYAALSTVVDNGDNALYAKRTREEDKAFTLGWQDKTVLNTTELDAGHVMVFELDIKFEDMTASTTNIWRLNMFTSGSNGRQAAIYFGTDANGKVRLNNNGGVYAFRLEQDVWYNIRFELDISGNCKVYVDNELQTYTSSGNVVDSFVPNNANNAFVYSNNRMEAAFQNTNDNSNETIMSGIYVDNIFLGSYTKAE